MTPRTRTTDASSLLARIVMALAALLLVGAALAFSAAPSRSADAAPGAAAPFSDEQKRAIEKVVKDYLIANPEVFLEIQQALETKMEQERDAKLKVAISENAKEIYHHPNGAVAGNPSGDITVVEFFDYNCGYCKRGLSGIAQLIEKDPKVRVVLKDLPILSKGSEEAAQVALAARLQGKYWEIHRALLENKGQNNEQTALKIAEKLGLDMTKLKADMGSPGVKAEIDRVRELAQKMGIGGTPHFLVGDRSIGGAPEDLYQQLSDLVADLRKNGCGVC